MSLEEAEWDGVETEALSKGEAGDTSAYDQDWGGRMRHPVSYTTLSLGSRDSEIQPCCARMRCYIAE